MTTKTRKDQTETSRILDAVHETARDLHTAGFISKRQELPAMVRSRVKLPLIECAHEARPGEEMTPERVADMLLEEEAKAYRDPTKGNPEVPSSRRCR